LFGNFSLQDSDYKALVVEVSRLGLGVYGRFRFFVRHKQKIMKKSEIKAEHVVFEAYSNLPFCKVCSVDGRGGVILKFPDPEP
jgi:hypothetical protein